MISVGSLNLIYQFWVHTEHVRRIGWLEWLLVSPSNHRVHHAKNPRYIDKNYGGVFIVWDRLFGTFEPESVDEPCRYGITRQLNSWNPLWANLHAWYDGLYQTWHTPKLIDKLRVWFKSPAWNAPGVPQRQFDWQAEKYAPLASSYARSVSFAQFWLHVAAVFVLLGTVSALSQGQVLATACWLGFGFYVQGVMLEGRIYAHWLEWSRLGCACLLVVWLPLNELYTQLAAAYLLVSAGLNIGLVRTTQSAGHLQSPG